MPDFPALEEFAPIVRSKDAVPIAVTSIRIETTNVLGVASLVTRRYRTG